MAEGWPVSLSFSSLSLILQGSSLSRWPLVQQGRQLPTKWVQTEPERLLRPKPHHHPLLLLPCSLSQSNSHGSPRFKRSENGLAREGWKELLVVALYADVLPWPISWPISEKLMVFLQTIIILALGIIYCLLFREEEGLVLSPSTWQPSWTPPSLQCSYVTILIRSLFSFCIITAM